MSEDAPRLITGQADETTILEGSVPEAALAPEKRPIGIIRSDPRQVPIANQPLAMSGDEDRL